MGFDDAVARLSRAPAPWRVIAALALSATACAILEHPPSLSAINHGPTTMTMQTETPTRTSSSAAFDELSARFLAEYLRLEPVRGTEAGSHTHDATWPDVTPAGDAARRAFAETTLAALAALPKDALDEQRRIDAGILDNQLRYRLFAADELRELDTNPLAYTGMIGDGLDPLITRRFAPLASRMQSLRGRLDGIPALLAAARQRLAHPSRVATETAIEQNRGLIALCATELPATFAKLPAERAALEASAARATAALRGFQAFLENDLLARSDGDFRLGADRFAKKLGFELEDDVSADALVRGARELLARTQDEMVETAKELWPTLMPGKPLPPLDTAAARKAFVKSALDVVAEDRPTNETIVAEGTRLLAEATAFVRAHGLVRIPDEPCGVIEMPEYRRGVAVAYCDASGPLEQNQETFFAIAPTPEDWSAARVASFYGEYNRGMLADLTVHEAMPGHFLQIMHANRFRSSVRAVFSSGPFVEGWAVYAEAQMARHGFGGPRVRLQRQKMVLRLSVNAILDHDTHAASMDEAAALALMTGEAFQEEGEAVGKWKRARLTSAQLTTYYYGFSEMTKLRAEQEARPGFTERAYHDRLLSYGSPAMRYVRELFAAK